MLMWLSQRRPRQPQPALRLLLALPIVVLLLSSYTSATPAAASSAEAERCPIQEPVSLNVLDTSVIQKHPLRIVLAGPSGAGKTLFCEFLRLALRTSGMADPAQASAEFLHHLRRDMEESVLSDKQKVTKYTETLSGGGSVEIYDTPGLLDTADVARDFEHLVEISKQLESLDYVDAVLLVFDGRKQKRPDDQMKEVLAQLSAVFQPAVYPNIALLFSHLPKPRQPGQMMIEPYLEAEFGFTSEEVKSRRFFVNNPLDAMATMFRPYAQGETIASVLQRGKRRTGYNYNDGVQELNRLLRYFATSVSRCTEPKFGTYSLKKGLSEYLERVLAGETAEDASALPANGAVVTLGPELASNKLPASLDAKIAVRFRKHFDLILQITYNLQTLIRISTKGKWKGCGKWLGRAHFAVVLGLVAYDILNPEEDQAQAHQAMMKELVSAQFKSVNEKLDSLVGKIQDVVHEEMKQASFQQTKDDVDTIIKVAGNLLTACRDKRESDSSFNALVLECNTFRPHRSLTLIRRCHLPDSEQYSILRSANYDHRKVADVHLALALILANLLRAADISSVVRGLATAGGAWRSQLLKRMSGGEADRTSDQTDMITEARSILDGFEAGILPKLRQGALSCGLPEDMRSVLQNHASTGDALDPLYRLVMDKYHPLFREDNLEFYVAVYKEYETGTPPVCQQFLRTNPDKTFNGSPCAVKVEKVNGKCAIVMWNTCKPTLDIKEFVSRLGQLLGRWQQPDSTLKSEADKLSKDEYSSLHWVRFGYGWRGRSSGGSGRFVCKSPFQLYPYTTRGWFGVDQFSLVIA